ncbi:M56 family metallopeptidase [Pedobacter faecalis]|uniref:M56 family metallopeptidase n=1 Tax=Pedobacter faecalis TaxID=3041495 RepID=UPI00254CA2FF|nr:M56 family metallopeptidase [Pedobacter sp. ELA7]
MTWAHYLLQVNIYLVVFYGFYKLLLDKETYFTLNRIYLLSAGVFSLVIPFLRIEWFVSQPAVQPVYTGAVQINDYLAQVSLAEAQPETFVLGQWLVVIYFTGVTFVIIRLALRLLSVKKMIRQASKGNAFSFLRAKVVDPALPGHNTIERHEEVHIRQWHTADLIFFELLSAVAWFNPVTYLYKKAVQNIHEYLADEAAAKFQGDKEQYTLLLLSKAFKIPQSELVNSFFNKSLIKKRIFMLHKQRSRKIGLIKYGLFLPLFAIALVMSSSTIRESEQIKAITHEIPLNEPLKAAQHVVKYAPFIQERKENLNEYIARHTQNDSIQNDWKPFYTHLMRSVRYAPSAREQSLQGNSTIKFTVLAGSVSDIGIVGKTLGGDLDQELMKAILSYEGYKRIKEGKYIITCEFSLAGVSTNKHNTNIVDLAGYERLQKVHIRGYVDSSPKNVQTNDTEDSVKGGDNVPDTKIYDFVSLERQPTYPGGFEQFYEWVQKTIVFPEEAKRNSVNGRVYLSFVVEKDGTLTDIKVERKLGYGTDEEAMRVLSNSQKWIPGMQNGEVVRVKFNIPILFSAAKEAKPPVANVEEQLNGKVQGLRIEARKTGANMINLKDLEGPTSPLYVIDGVRLKAINNGKERVSPLSNINQNHILSIEILKDATAVQKYGTDGKNGVIVITTKNAKGKQKQD